MLENEITEFKREYTDDIKKTVIAFANTAGGALYIGIDNDGQVCGVDDPDSVMLKCSNSVRDSIRPDVTMFVSYQIEEKESKKIIAISVQKGTAVPYYLESKGLKPSGVYIRQGASTVPASEAAILKMIRETGGDKYESMRSIQQELTFTCAEKEFERAGVQFEQENRRTLKLISEDGNYTNLGLLLSDQCPHMIKAARFSGTEKVTFQTREEFSGSLLKQANEAYEFLSKFNNLRSEFDGLHRVDREDYPPEAIREALLNAIVHRDYGLSASILVSVFDDRIEIVSVGGLVKGIGKEEIFIGLSVQRNENLANVFYRLQLIEAFGTGIPRIVQAYRNFGLSPVFEITDNAFKITLPNINTNSQKENGNTEPISLRKTVSDEDIIKMYKSKGVITRATIQSDLETSQATAVRIIKRLLEKGLVVKSGNGRKTVYTIAERDARE
ncbi:MAG: putative DNA binding domain-containing protein [Ruminococcus flavefaciens]|nr:putative DNA binding domain-containing protein [Ruminococcus flavefaciens]MCM1380760.1 putative DNA binding domain-containing protein [Muribaculaceae bacterium]MCM1479392.1 putative DNA binding domain-containing protein [Muribaculaceae bacterium]